MELQGQAIVGHFTPPCGGSHPSASLTVLFAIPMFLPSLMAVAPAPPLTFSSGFGHVSVLIAFLPRACTRTCRVWYCAALHRDLEGFLEGGSWQSASWLAGAHGHPEIRFQRRVLKPLGPGVLMGNGCRLRSPFVLESSHVLPGCARVS